MIYHYWPSWITLNDWPLLKPHHKSPWSPIYHHTSHEMCIFVDWPLLKPGSEVSVEDFTVSGLGTPQDVDYFDDPQRSRRSRRGGSWVLRCDGKIHAFQRWLWAFANGKFPEIHKIMMNESLYTYLITISYNVTIINCNNIYHDGLSWNISRRCERGKALNWSHCHPRVTEWRPKRCVPTEISTAETGVKDRTKAVLNWCDCPPVNVYKATGKVTVCYGKSPFLRGKLTISMDNVQ